MNTAKAKIDALTKEQIKEFREKIMKCKTQYDQLVTAGRIISSLWILNWNGEDAKYLIMKCGVRLLMW